MSSECRLAFVAGIDGSDDDEDQHENGDEEETNEENPFQRCPAIPP